MKISPGERLGIAEAIAGEVLSIPIRKRDWNKVTLKITNHILGSVNFNNYCRSFSITVSENQENFPQIFFPNVYDMVNDLVNGHALLFFCLPYSFPINQTIGNKMRLGTTVGIMAHTGGKQITRKKTIMKSSEFRKYIGSHCLKIFLT